MAKLKTGILAREGTPAAIVEKVANEAMAVVRMPEVARLYEGNGIEPTTAPTSDGRPSNWSCLGGSWSSRATGSFLRSGTSTLFP